MVGNDKKWKSLWDTSAMLLLLGGPALLFAAFCIYAFTHVVNLQIAIAGALAFLIGILMMCFPAYEGKESLSGLAGLGKSAAHTFLVLVLAVGLIACLALMLINALGSNPLNALLWAAAGTALYFIARPFKSKPPTPEEIREYNEKRRKKQAELEAKEQERRMAAMREKLKKVGKMCPYCESENVVPIGTTRKPYSIGRGLIIGAITQSTALGAAGAIRSPGKVKMICKSCGQQFKIKPRSH